MLALTDRYEVESIDPLCDGWSFGLGYDKRLQRPVLIALLVGKGIESPFFLQWLHKRSGVSHENVAELLDGEKINDTFMCVFARPTKVHIGLPSLERTKIYKCAEVIVNTMRFLETKGIYFRFSAGQVLWDGVHARLLGIPAIAHEQGGSVGNPTEIAQYLNNLLEWNVSFEKANGYALPAYLEKGLQRLQLFDENDHQAYASLLGIVSTMTAGEEGVTVESAEDVSEDVSETSLRVVTALPLRSWMTLAGVIVLVVVGLVWWYGYPRRQAVQQLLATPSVSGHNVPSGGASVHNKVMPALVGRSIQTALIDLHKAGIADRQIRVYTQLASAQAGSIVSTLPQSGQPLTHQGAVVLTVSTPSGTVLMPDLIGLTLQSATRQLLMIPLHYAYVDHNAPQAQAGRVISQVPAPYDAVNKSILVKFVVATHY